MLEFLWSNVTSSGTLIFIPNNISWPRTPHTKKQQPGLEGRLINQKAVWGRVGDSFWSANFFLSLCWNIPECTLLVKHYQNLQMCTLLLVSGWPRAISPTTTHQKRHSYQGQFHFFSPAPKMHNQHACRWWKVPTHPPMDLSVNYPDYNDTYFLNDRKVKDDSF